MKIGDRVVATLVVTEGGDDGDENALFPDAAYVHARRGEVGTVEHVDPDGFPTVRFERTGTATICSLVEVEPCGECNGEKPPAAAL